MVFDVHCGHFYHSSFLFGPKTLIRPNNVVEMKRSVLQPQSFNEVRLIKVIAFDRNFYKVETLQNEKVRV